MASGSWTSPRDSVVAPGENRVFGEQIGPGRSARAIAIVQIAVFDALVAVNGGYTSYTGLPRVKGQVSTKAAVAYAAHDTLVEMFPAQKASFDGELRDSLRRLRDSSTAIFNGVHPESFFASNVFAPCSTSVWTIDGAPRYAAALSWQRRQFARRGP